MLCKTCKTTCIYSEVYDASYCPSCNTWINSNCGDKKCEFCSHRPVRPLPIDEEIK